MYISHNILPYMSRCVSFGPYNQFIVDSSDVFTYIVQGCFTGAGLVEDMNVCMKLHNGT